MQPPAPAHAFQAEAERLSAVLAVLGPADLARPTPCRPWTVADLLGHLTIAVGRLPGMLARAELPGGPLTSAAAYYAADRRFASAVDAERVATAQAEAARLGSGAAMAVEFDRAWRASLAALRAAAAGTVVRTRHGDRMTASEFTRTRVLELGVHGLDLAAGLGRAPWLTGPAAAVIGGLVLPGGAAARVRGALGWDQVTLVAKTTGREPIEAAKRAVCVRYGLRDLALGPGQPSQPGGAPAVGERGEHGS
jgi:uncharacterized protein (TIGR03083 family)